MWTTVLGTRKHSTRIWITPNCYFQKKIFWSHTMDHKASLFYLVNSVFNFEKTGWRYWRSSGHCSQRALSVLALGPLSPEARSPRAPCLGISSSQHFSLLLTALAPEADCQLPFLQHLSCCLFSSCLLFFLLLFLVPVGISVCTPINLQIERDLTVLSLSLFLLPLWSSVTIRLLLPICFLL